MEEEIRLLSVAASRNLVAQNHNWKQIEDFICDLFIFVKKKDNGQWRSRLMVFDDKITEINYFQPMKNFELAAGFLKPIVESCCLGDAIVNWIYSLASCKNSLLKKNYKVYANAILIATSSDVKMNLLQEKILADSLKEVMPMKAMLVGINLSNNLQSSHALARVQSQIGCELFVSANSEELPTLLEEVKNWLIPSSMEQQS